MGACSSFASRRISRASHLTATLRLHFGSICPAASWPSSFNRQSLLAPRQQSPSPSPIRRTDLAPCDCQFQRTPLIFVTSLAPVTSCSWIRLRAVRPVRTNSSRRLTTTPASCSTGRLMSTRHSNPPFLHGNRATLKSCFGALTSGGATPRPASDFSGMTAPTIPPRFKR